MEPKQASFRDDPKFNMGRTGEKTVAEILQRRGWYIIPSYDYSGEDGDKAPKLHGAFNSYVIPDLDASKEGLRIWVEVKTKTAATYTRITRRLEHGIPYRHFRSYREVEQITGCPVYLVVYEIETGEVLAGRLVELEKNARYSDSTVMGKMIFFPRDVFKVMARLNEKVADS